MRYYVVDQDGQKDGPADVPTLQEWVREGRLVGGAVLEEGHTGHRTTAAGLLGAGAFGAQPGSIEAPSSPAGSGEPTSLSMQPGSGVPYQLQGKFNWGVLVMGWIWGPNHEAYVTLWQIPVAASGVFISLLPDIALLVLAIWFGFKGFEWAWQSGRFQTVEHCLEVQRIWMLWGVGLLVAQLVLAFLALMWAVGSMSPWSY